MKIKGILITENLNAPSEIEIENGVIISIKEISFLPNMPIIVPSFVDLHNHGGAGFDFMSANQNEIREIAKIHAKHGTSYILATTVTDTHENLLKAFKNIKEVFDNCGKDEAKIMGVHLEGPYINMEKIGVQPHFTRDLNIKEVEELNNIVPIKVITLAPEIVENKNNLLELQNMGIKIQIGHSNATYEETLEAIKNGVSSFTHLYNAMSSLEHRKPGVVGAALAHANYSEIIPDLIHVHEGAIKVATRAIPNIYAVTDATSATGMPDGDYKLGINTVHKSSNVVRLNDGTLAGSCLTMIDAFKNFIKLEYSLEDAVALTSLRAAGYIGLEHDIKVGSVASFLVLNPISLDIEQIYI